VRKNSSAWRMFGGRVFKLLIYKTQIAIVRFVVQNACNRCVLFCIMREGNHNLYGCVTEQHG
jgi:hypothetical protein